MSDENKETPPYPVGYRKPPRRTQFTKGRSGNPKGRPKGTPNFATALEQALSEQVIVNEGGQRYPVTKLVATVKQLVNKATQGDPRATQQVLNVLHVLDSDSGESSQPCMNITEADQLVMQHLIARIRHTEGENNEPAHR
jgi:hypothetical protein